MHLWIYLRLNSSMSCEPDPHELIYSIATRQEAQKRVISRHQRPIIDMHFSAAPVHSEDSQVVVFVENVGLVATDW